MGRFEEILLVLVIIVFLFGGSKLPGLGKAVGQFMSEFKKASKGEDDKDEEKTAKPVAETHKPQLALPPSEAEKAAKRRKKVSTAKKKKAKR
jgi:sec-independent protein translocase protein TatA